MEQPQVNICQEIARAAHASEKRRRKNGRDWVAVFMNEDTIVIALHGYFTDAEKTLMRSPAGAAQVRLYHRRLFTGCTDTLGRQIKCITEMDVRDTAVEIDPTTGSVVHVFTTATVLADFLRAPRGLSEGHGSLAGAKDSDVVAVKAGTPVLLTPYKEHRHGAIALGSGKNTHATFQRRCGPSRYAVSRPL